MSEDRVEALENALAAVLTTLLNRGADLTVLSHDAFVELANAPIDSRTAAEAFYEIEIAVDAASNSLLKDGIPPGSC